MVQLFATAMVVAALIGTGLSPVVMASDSDEYSEFGRLVLQRETKEVLQRELMSYAMSMSMRFSFSYSYSAPTNQPTLSTPSPILPTTAPTTLVTQSFAPQTLAPQSASPIVAPTSAPISTSSTPTPVFTPLPTIQPPSTSSPSVQSSKLAPDDFRTPSPTHVIFPAPACIPSDYSSPSSNVAISLEVETSTLTVDLDDLSRGVLDSLLQSFSLCAPSQRKLTERRLVNSTASVNGVKVAGTSISQNETCQSVSIGSSCHVVDMVMIVYSNSTLTDATQAVYRDLVTQLEQGALLGTTNSNLTLVRLRTSRDGDPGGAENRSQSDSNRGLSVGLTAATVVSVLAAAAIVVVGVRWATKRRQSIVSPPSHDGLDPDTCDVSFMSTAADTATPTVVTGYQSEIMA